MRVLVTGVCGAIGSTVAPALAAQGHEVRGLDLVAPDDRLAAALSAGMLVGDVLDPMLADQAVEGVDAVVHLAGLPEESTLTDELTSHAHTTAVLLDAMVRHGVDRFVYASSNHAVGMVPRTDRLEAEVRPRPDTFYGVAKVAAEALMNLYADRFGMTAVALRIGSFREEPTTRRALSTWLSPGDAVHLVEAALTTDESGFIAVYGISANTRAWWDLGPGRRIGYAPRDNAEAFAASIPDREEDEAEGDRVGGPFAVMPLGRPLP
ncbi:MULTISPECIES: NAD-dependent epimerase/dehydratase family protein [Mumia]|uniref:NAD-dependent epimerase/dehydratase family protein n=1 Tax=Mumia TaxID=1546255 RepID=UPI0014230BAB|nr:NAD(P)-dependent oxidoreductase [Mumia sp. ZJ430]